MPNEKYEESWQAQRDEIINPTFLHAVSNISELEENGAPEGRSSTPVKWNQPWGFQGIKKGQWNQSAVQTMCWARKFKVMAKFGVVDWGSTLEHLRFGNSSDEAC